MKNDELLSQTISYLRFPLIVGVVFIHYNLAENGFSIHGVKYGLDNPDWYYHIIYFFSGVLPSICVPLFFIISGFLFFYRKDFNSMVYKQKLRTRARTLLLPFLLWNIIAILIQASYKLPFLSSVFPHANKMDIILSPERLFNTFFAYYENEGIFVSSVAEEVLTEANKYPFPINFPLWYVRDLIVMVILSPLIYWMIKRCGLWFISLLGMVWFFTDSLIFTEGGYATFFFTAAFFFSSGAYFSINGRSFVECMRQAKYVPLIYLPLAFADTVTKGADYNVFIHESGILTGVASAVIVSSYLIEKGTVRVHSALTDSCFFILALHILIMSNIGKVLFSILHLPDSTYSMLLLYFFVPIITITLCTLTHVFLGKYLHPVCKLLTGGR